MLDFTLSGILLNGPVRLPHLSRLPTLDDLRAKPVAPLNPPSKTLLQELEDCFFPPAVDRLRGAGFQAHTPPPRSYRETVNSFALVDEVPRELAVRDPWSKDCIPWLRLAWPGWEVKPLEGGVDGYFQCTGRPVPTDLAPVLAQVEPSPVPMNYGEQLTAIKEYLFQSDEGKKTLIQATTAIARAHDRKDAVFAPGLLDAVPPASLAPDERQRIWARAVEAAWL